MPDNIYSFSVQPDQSYYYVSPYEYGSIEFEEGLTRSDFRLVEDSENLIMYLKNTDIEIIISGQFSPSLAASETNGPILIGTFFDGTEISLYNNVLFESNYEQLI